MKTETKNIKMRAKKSRNLADAAPAYLKDWDHKTNGDIIPSAYIEHEWKTVSFICDAGHSYSARVREKTNGRGECLLCRAAENKIKRERKHTGKKIKDLYEANPDCLKEWDTEKNGILKPGDYTLCSGDSVYWICPKGHSYSARIAHRTKTFKNEYYKTRGCPYCSGQRVLKGYNDLATVNPELASLWHPTRNGDLLPTMFPAHCNRKMWWRCKEGHEYPKTIAQMTATYIPGEPCTECRKAERALEKAEKEREKAEREREKERLERERKAFFRKELLKYLKNNESISIRKAADTTGCPYEKTNRYLREMESLGILEKRGRQPHIVFSLNLSEVAV